MLRVAEQAHRTDTGRQRQANEDALFARSPLFAVADGMGGARAGEVAARLAATALEEAGRSVEDVAGLISEANRRIWERSLADPKTAGMGTTVTAALVVTPRLTPLPTVVVVPFYNELRTLPTVIERLLELDALDGRVAASVVRVPGIGAEPIAARVVSWCYAAHHIRSL